RHVLGAELEAAAPGVDVAVDPGGRGVGDREPGRVADEVEVWGQALTERDLADGERRTEREAGDAAAEPERGLFGADGLRALQAEASGGRRVATLGATREAQDGDDGAHTRRASMGRAAASSTRNHGIVLSGLRRRCPVSAALLHRSPLAQELLQVRVQRL